MKKIIVLCLLNLFVFFCFAQTVIADGSRVTILKEMFDKVTVGKNERAIPLYYDKDFKLFSNGTKMDFDAFLKMHRDIYKTSIQYKVRYDEKTFVEQGNRVGGRLFITTKRPNELAREIEVILIAEYKDNKLYRLWELTYPDWSKMKAFQKNSK
jgi:hypothetical protein